MLPVIAGSVFCVVFVYLRHARIYTVHTIHTCILHYTQGILDPALELAKLECEENCIHYTPPITCLLTQSTPQGILDPALELAKLEKKRGEAAGRADALRGKMAMPSYQDKTPDAVKVRVLLRGWGISRKVHPVHTTQHTTFNTTHTHNISTQHTSHAGGGRGKAGQAGGRGGTTRFVSCSTHTT